MTDESSSAIYDEIAQKLLRTSWVTDPWIDGVPRFSEGAYKISPSTYTALMTAAQELCAVYEELASLIWDDPSHLDSFFNLTPWQKTMWFASGGLWHVFARLDLFICSDGSIKAAEINADTPSGQSDAAAIENTLCALSFSKVDHLPAQIDVVYQDRLRQAWQIYHAAIAVNAPPLTTGARVGILYPTEMPEDLGLIRLYESWLRRWGWKPILGSPYNLKRRADGSLTLLGEPIQSVLRHYKTDWWGERETTWLDDEEIPDADPLSEQMSYLLDAQRRGKISVINPWGSVVTQNKLSMAFFWENLHLFSENGQKIIQRYIPPTYRLTTMLTHDPRNMRDVHETDGADEGDATSKTSARLQREQPQWVLKSDYGCEGSEVVIGAFVDAETWRDALTAAKTTHFVVQRFFDVMPTTQGQLPNFGVYIVAGIPSGLLLRLTPQHTGTDVHAVVAAVHVSSTPSL